tara:strand:- start:344 stop:535 length:192 start_codon:yes stop_codon:yes gene_type:complete
VASKTDALFCQVIKVGGFEGGLPVTAQIPETKIIGQNVNEVGSLSGGRCERVLGQDRESRHQE